MTFFLSLDFYKGQEKLDENFMWFKKLSVLNFNKKVETATAYFWRAFRALREKAVLLAMK